MAVDSGAHGDRAFGGRSRFAAFVKEHHAFIVDEKERELLVACAHLGQSLTLGAEVLMKDQHPARDLQRGDHVRRCVTPHGRRKDHRRLAFFAGAVERRAGEQSRRIGTRLDIVDGRPAVFRIDANADGSGLAAQESQRTTTFFVGELVPGDHRRHLRQQPRATFHVGGDGQRRMPRRLVEARFHLTFQSPLVPGHDAEAGRRQRNDGRSDEPEPDLLKQPQAETRVDGYKIAPSRT